MVFASFDHIVIGAASLAEGVAYVKSKLGVAPVEGGKHRTEGTHNALLSLGADRYLEVIAIDPEGEKPARARWFALDSEAMQASLSDGPKLITWVARTPGLKALAAQSPEPLGSIMALSRGPYRWQICRRDDGGLVAGGLIPLLIQWDSSEHPAAALPDSGCSLQRLAGRHPRPERVEAGLKALGLADELELGATEEGEAASFDAVIQCPLGEVVLNQ